MSYHGNSSYHGRPTPPAVSDKEEIDTTQRIIPKFDEQKTGLLFRPSNTILDNSPGPSSTVDEKEATAVVFLRRSSLCEVRPLTEAQKAQQTRKRSQTDDQVGSSSQKSLSKLWNGSTESLQSIAESKSSGFGAQLGGSTSDLQAIFKGGNSEGSDSGSKNGSKTKKMHIYNRQYGKLESSCENHELEVSKENQLCRL
eukprot:9503863-Pyramimonas_sp.AAC.1